MVSWWIRWEDLNWPSPDNMDRIRRRADEMAEAAVNTATVFGAHFRWDFLPYWEILHDYMAAVAEELHKRGIRFWDHHSAVLIHRYSNREEMRRTILHQGPHLPFSPSREAAESWMFNGYKLNDWRQIDVLTGKPHWHSGYSAESFCWNNPAFMDSYLLYLKKLIRDTGIDGLMSDDTLYFKGFEICACPCCRKLFRERFGYDLPDAANAEFWGNFENPDWKAYIAMRFEQTGLVAEKIRAVLPSPAYPLMTCNSGSTGGGQIASAQDVLQLNRGCNFVHLEMCGDTPPWRHDPEVACTTIADRVVAAAYHRRVAREQNLPCIGQGYGFTEASAGIIWALNKALGSSCWFSTLKGRLGLPDSVLATLPGDAEPAAKAFRFEREHPELFTGTPVSKTAIFFSYETRSNSCWGVSRDYERELRAAVSLLFSSSCAPDMIHRIPENTEEFSVIVLPGTLLLTEQELLALRQFVKHGGTVFATGPSGLPGVHLEGEYPAHLETARLFQGFNWIPDHFPPLRNERKWTEPEPGVFWHPDTLADHPETGKQLVERIRPLLPRDETEILSANGFYAFRYRNATHTLIHFLAADYETAIDEELDRIRFHRSRVHLITGATPLNTASEILLNCEAAIEVFSPLTGPQPEIRKNGKETVIEVPENAPYLICRIPNNKAQTKKD